jgi:hypothetical protein
MTYDFGQSAASYAIYNINRFRGVDYANNPTQVSDFRSPDAVNVEPALNGAVRCRNGYEEVLDCGGRINGVYTLTEATGSHTLIHHGNKISEWRNHKMFRYTVPAEGLAVDYTFTIGESAYTFTREKLKSGDTTLYTVSTGKLTVNGAEQALAAGNSGTPVYMEAVKYIGTLKRSDFGSYTTCSVGFVNPSGKTSNNYLITSSKVNAADIPEAGIGVVYDQIAHALFIGETKYTLVDSTSSGSTVLIALTAEEYVMAQRVVRYTLNRDYFSSSGYLSVFAMDDPENKKYVLRTIVGVNIADVPEEGIVFTYYGGTERLKWTAGGKSHNINMVRSLSSEYNFSGYDSIWFCDADYELLPVTPEGVNYTFSAGDVSYYFSCIGLSALDELCFDSVTKYLYLNDVKINSGTDILSGQTLVMSEYYSPLIRLDALLPDTKSSCVQVDNMLYIFTGAEAYVYGEFDVFDADGGKTGTTYDLRTMADEAYIPITHIGGSPVKSSKASDNASVVESGGSSGTAYENVNLLSAKRIEQFMVSAESSTTTPLSGTGTWYYKLPLAVAPIECVDKVEKLDADGSWVKVLPGKYTVNAVTGLVIFDECLDVSPISSISAGDNYRVTYTVSYAGSSDDSLKTFNISDRTAYTKFQPPSVPLEKYTVPLYRFYIGNQLENMDSVVVTANLGTTDGYGRSGYIGDDEDKALICSFDTAVISAASTGIESGFQLPSGKIAYYIHNYKRQAVAQWKVYSRVIQEGNKFYIEVTPPYSWCVWRYTNSDGGTTTSRNLEIADVKSFSVASRSFKNQYLDRVNKATVCTKFGHAGNMDRIIVAGWDEMSEYEFWSEVGNPLYFPDLNYACLGDEDTRIMGWSRINNGQLAVHKSENGADPTVYVQTSNSSGEGSYGFSFKEGPVGEGAASSGAFGVLNGEPLFLAKSGVYATKYVEDVAADVRYAVPRSYYINPKLSEMDLSGAEAIVYNGRYYLAAGGYVFLADGNQIYSVGGERTGEYSYEWYVWDNIPVRVWFIYNDILYFGTDQGKLCRFTDGYTDNGEPINCYWMTPALNFGTTAHYKKIKNCIVTCAMPTTEFSEVSIDCITDKFDKNVKNYLIDNTSKLGAVKSIATNYKLKRVSNLQLRIRANNAENFLLCDISILYLAAGRYKG